MKKLSFLSAVVTAMISTSAFAENTVHFDQTDEAGANTVGIGTLTIKQTGTAANRIGAGGDVSLVEGALATLTIKQLNSSTTETQNSADITLYGSDDSTAGSLVASFDGSDNAYDLTVGANGDATPYVNPDIALTVDGDGNSVSDTLANGAAATDTLNYAGTITGDSNTVTTSSSNGVNSVDIDYGITGSDNTVTMAMANAAGDFDIDVALTGSDSDWTLNAQSSTNSKIDLTQNGDKVTGTIGQTGDSSSMVMGLTKTGTDLLTVTTSATGSGQSANIGLVALGGGSFTLNQSTDDSVYTANHAITADGSVTVNQ